jgi:hypothetical protein
MSPSSLMDSHNSGPFPATKWIRFLRQYGPIPQNGNAFDENIQRSAKRYGIDPIRLPTPALDEMLSLLQAETPTSVIVTGTAGDGKTYHCRELWRRLGGSEEAWAQSEKVKRLSLPNGRELLLVRDLSEFQLSDREHWFPKIAKDLLDEHSSSLYLIAANHGRLIDEWKAAPQTDEVKVVRAAVEDLLVKGATDSHGVRVRIVDLSQQSSVATLDALFEAVLNHPGWDGCAHCAVVTGERVGGCPILENRGRLQGETDGGLLRTRLAELLELSERNRVHFSVRQLLLLTSNAILGHPEAEHGLMMCGDVPGILQAGTADRATVYGNIFGENISARRRETTAVFDSLGRFGVGNETSNRIDAILVYGADDPDLRSLYERLVLSDAIYGGSSSFKAQQRAYLESSEVADRTSFLGMLRGQRQRLFFTIPHAEVDSLGLWELTVFRYAGRYLDIVRRVGRGDAVPNSTISPLVRGLNRVFTGILVTNQDQLILASSGSHAQAKTSRLLEDLIPVAFRLGEGVILRRHQGQSNLSGVDLVVALGNVDGVEPVKLPLTLLRYEFLNRVADGALPSSFSLECYEDFLAFKANILESLQQRRLVTGEDQTNGSDLVLRFLRIGADGRVNPDPVEVRLT